MGLFDTLALPACLSLPGFDRDPSTVEWQTKSIGRLTMDTYRITTEGRLLQAEFHTERVPAEERPATGSDACDDPLFETADSIRRVHDGWSERHHHGEIVFYAGIEQEWVRYEADCTEGLVTAIRQREPEAGDWQAFETLLDGDRDVPMPAFQLSRTQTLHLRSLLADLTEELDAIHDDDIDPLGGLTGRGAVRCQRAQRGVTHLQQYLDWRADRRDGPD